MLAVSDAYRTAIAASHTIKVAGTVQNRQSELLLTLPDDAIADGGVTVDRTASFRRRVDVTLADATGYLNPLVETDALAPFGNELAFSRGVVLPDGTAEMLPLGVFLFQKVTTPDDSSSLGSIVIEGWDRSKRVSLAQFTDGYVIDAGTNYGQAIRDMIDAGVPGLTYEFQGTDSVTPVLAYNQQDDRWSKAVDMAAAIGMEVFFDPYGVCVMRPEPDPDSDAISWAYADTDHGMLLTGSREWNTEETYSSVTAYASGTGVSGAIPTATVFDDNPDSATYFLGEFGLRTYFYPSPLLTDTNQCINAANAQLRRVTGSYQVINLSTIVNPAHEGGDVVSIVDSRTGVNARYVLDQFTIPLVPETECTAMTKKRTV